MIESISTFIKNILENSELRWELPWGALVLSLIKFYNTPLNSYCECMSYAIIKTGSKQYRVQKGLVIDVEKLVGEPGDQIVLTDVLQIALENQEIIIGQPLVAGAEVVCEFVKQKRAPKVMIMKLRRRKNSRRKAGHRQSLSVLRILEIRMQGETPNGN
jgi:large subunit ribosomal protein L21